MVFSSLTFIFVFLPLCIIIYFLVPSNKILIRKYILMAFSIVFYASGEPIYVLLIVLSVAIIYLLSRQIEKSDTFAFVLALIVILFPLCLFKYSNFIIDNVNVFFNSHISNIGLVMPIGISFYTFQMLTYIIDLYKKKVKRQNNIGLLTLYIFFFPQLIAGPIVKYTDIENALNSSNEDWGKIKEGTQRFIKGLAKKVIIANQVGVIVDQVTATDFSRVSTLIMWLASIAFTIQLYFDFSGYSDMAIGLGKIFGFEFKENFNLPYHSLSVTEFWRRWHISMGSFFRDYIYIPLGGSKKSKFRQMINILIVWTLTGLWHGANWNFVVWGLYYAIILMVEKIFLGRIIKKSPKFISWVYTFFITVIGWTLFMWNTNSFHDIIIRIGRLFSQKEVVFPFSVTAFGLNAKMIYLFIGIIFSIPIGKWIVDHIVKLLEPYVKNKMVFAIVYDAFMIALFIFCIGFLVGDTFNPFIYFRF